MRPSNALLYVLPATLCGVVGAIRTEDALSAALSSQEDEEPSIRAFDFRGFTDAMKISFTNGSHVDVQLPFFSLAGKAQTNPCKLVMYRSAKHVLQKSPAEIKMDTVLAAKVQLVELCKSFAGTGKLQAACEALNLHEEAGRIQVLGKTTLKPEEEESQEEESHEDDAEDAGDAIQASDAAPENEVTKNIVRSVQSFACMVKEGAELSRVPVKRMTGSNWVSRGFAAGVNFAKRRASQAKAAVTKMVARLQGSVIRRFSKGLAQSKFCFGDCKKWEKLLKTAVGDQATYPESCQDFLSELGMMELKGDPNERLGSIDLTSLHVGSASRKVEVSAGRSLKVSLQNTLSTEIVQEVDLGSGIASGYEQVSSPWEDLHKYLSSRQQKCTVDKVGVFNMGLKRRWNGFQLKERFPWKVLFLSRAGIQIHSQHAHGKNYGYDLHGDPEELEYPCKWMSKARERGLKPRNRLLPVSDLNFSFFNKTIALPKYLYEPSNVSMLWMDEDNKFPIPEWMRGMRKVWDVNKSKLPTWMIVSDGRDSQDYSKYLAWDMRGLHTASDAPEVLGKLRELGWQPDPLVVVEKSQNESAQLSGAIVNSVYPYNKQLAGLPSLPTDPFRHGGENKLWSIYDYTESYLQSCFSIDATSLPSANDGASDLGGDLTATIALCTNNFVGGNRSSLPSASQILREDVMQELVRYFSEGKPEGMQVASSIAQSCYSETDCTGNTCLMPSDCKENTDSPCPIGHGCACDTRKTQAIFTVAVAASVLSEGTRNTLTLGPGLIAACEAAGVAGAAFGGLALVPLCPVLIPLMFYAVAPMGSDIFMAFILASILGGLNTCGCIPLNCEASARMKNSVCALYHKQEVEMVNEYHFIPAPGEKCVPTKTLGMGITGCGSTSCSPEELADAKVGWHAENGKVYGHSVGIYNCKKGDFNASDVNTTSAFDYKTFVDLHPNWTELRTNMVPQAQAPKKFSGLALWTEGLPKGVQKCFEGRKGLRKGLGYLCSFKRVVGTFASFVMGMMEKLLNFMINVVLGALKLVRFVFFTLMSVITKDLGGQRKWAGQCPSVEDDATDTTTPASLMQFEDEDVLMMPQYMSQQERLGFDSLCMSGQELRPCGEVDLSEYYL